MCPDELVPDGKNLVFVAKSGGSDALIIYDVKQKEITTVSDRVLAQSFRQAGVRPRNAFTAVKKRKADIFLVNPRLKTCGS